MTDNQDNVLRAESVNGRPAKIIYETRSGVIFHITEINLPTLRAIQLKAQDLYPYPDKAPYQQPEENAFDDSQLTPAEDNPEYVSACLAVDSERAQWTDRAIFGYATICPAYPTPAAMVAAFKSELDKLRQVAILPKDDYEAVLLHLVLSWNQVGVDKDKNLKPTQSDYSRIIQLAIQTVALSPAEVQAGVRFFRIAVSGR